MAEGSLVGAEAAKLLPTKTRPELSEFVVGSTNRMAHAALTALAEGAWQENQNPIMLIGGYGVGKTHLMRAVVRKFLQTYRLTEGVVYTTAENFGNLFITAVREKYQPKVPAFRRWSREAKLLLIDEVGFFKGKNGMQEEFVVVLDERLKHGRPTVCASNVKVKDLGLSPSLQSRLMGGLTVEVGPLTNEIRRGILDRLIDKAGQGAKWSNDIRCYLTERLDGDARAVIGVYNAVYLHSQSLGTIIDQKLVDKVLAVYGLGESLPELSLESIEKTVEEYFGLLSGGSHQLRSQSRSRDICHPRQVAMYLAKQIIPGLSLTEIGSHFGGRDHTTALAAIKRIDGERRKSQFVSRELGEICSKIGVKWPL